MSILKASEVRSREGGASFVLRHRIVRLLFHVVWRVACSWTPVPFYGWRRLVLRCFGADISTSAKVYPSTRIWYPPNLIMAEYSCLGPEVNCYSMDRISLGPYALVSQNAQLCAGTHDVDDAHFQLITKPIRLEANAWVAAEAFVGPGVTIGEYAVLGARGVAFRDLEPGHIYAGNPARILRARRWNGG